MDAKTLRSKTEKGLRAELQDALVHLKQLQFSASSNQLKNVREIRKTKKIIARIRTLLVK
ncbi:50S ribosomal protein L29 [Candidatus Uhrbacteria bacterium]|jgi:ribosomal protein L29|nr:50S ribosomal protein L29 [Candidatus Uhrbacteria bacterium]